VAEDHLTVLMRQVLVELDARAGLSQHGSERRLADLERLAAKIPTVELKQVEGVEAG